MTASYLQALAAIAVSLAVLMAGAWGGCSSARAIPAGSIPSGPFRSAGRRRERIVAGRRCCAQRPAMAGGGFGRDLVAAARGPYRDPYRRDIDTHRDEIERVLRKAYGGETALWMRLWRWFFLATSGLFSYADGSEWGVSHYRLKAA